MDEARLEAIRAGVKRRNDGYRKFTDDEVLADIDRGLTITRLAEKFGCNPRTIHRIARAHSRFITKERTASGHIIWDDELTERLKSLWALNYSANEIGRQLGGVTKNSVIGRAHRIGLPERKSPVRAKPGNSVRPYPKVRKLKSAGPPKPLPNIKDLPSEERRIQIAIAAKTLAAKKAPPVIRAKSQIPLFTTVAVVPPPVTAVIVPMPEQKGRQCMAIDGPRFQQTRCQGIIERGSYCGPCADKFYITRKGH